MSGAYPDSCKYVWGTVYPDPVYMSRGLKPWTPVNMSRGLEPWTQLIIHFWPFASYLVTQCRPKYHLTISQSELSASVHFHVGLTGTTMDRSSRISQQHTLNHLLSPNFSYINPIQIQSFQDNEFCFTVFWWRLVTKDGKTWALARSCFLPIPLLLFEITSGSPNCCDFEEEGRRHRIAFNSLYLVSFRSIIYEANGVELYNFTRGGTVSRISNQYAASTVSAIFCVERSIVSGRRGLHGRVIYPYWLVLSARLLLYMLPS